MAAAHVEEMESKFNTVFKTISAEADTWATNYANAIGRSKYEIKEAISNQADLMIGMGMTEEVATLCLCSLQLHCLGSLAYQESHSQI